MATSVLAQFESGHTDAVHDAVFDYYGRRLATCSSDRAVKVFDVQGEQVTLLADLVGHEGPVWEVSWAHPCYGPHLASASFDGQVIVWREEADGTWTQAAVLANHRASVNSVAWAPEGLGLALAAASSDGSVSVSTAQEDGSWVTETIQGAHPPGALAVAWEPAGSQGAAGADGSTSSGRRLATAGADGAVRLWSSPTTSPGGGFSAEPALPAGHSDWVRDVAWSPSFGSAPAVLASAGQDGRVLLWTEGPGGTWTRSLLHEFKTPVWRLSWSVSGGVLAVSDGNDQLSLWKQQPDGTYQRLEE